VVGAGLVLIVLLPGVAFQNRTVGWFGKSETTSAGGVRSRGCGWYFRSGQWRADARTLVAVARWCLEATPSTTAGTNLNFGLGLAHTNGAVVSRT